ncbi:MAG: Gfo/Idh/MocA family oxidoreductase [Planctomycetes bacterium]|nr:Gfo/Idh/MocA family oxidoreductase [Planctomycetota bacterium]
MPNALRCGIVGPGRSRNGLGPFLARFAAASGLTVVAGAGRDATRSRAACEDLARRLGHAVEAYEDVEAMLAQARLDALIVAAPPAAHRRALELALAQRCAVLCEKPLVADEDRAAVDGLLDAFLAHGVPLVENCQWPHTLDTFDALWPGVRGGAGAFAMGLSPGDTGLGMVVDSLSHFVSLAQAIVPLDGRSTVRVHAAPRIAPGDTQASLDVEFAGSETTLCGRFELRVVSRQPRPAWFAIAGRRVDRRIALPEYRFAFETPDGRRETLADPMQRLVYGFAALVRSKDLDLIRAESERIRHRARFYHAILDACRGAARRSDP